MKENKLLFTEGFIDRLTPGNKRVRYYDTKVHGLILEVMPSGSKIYRLRRTINYKDEVATISNHPDCSLEQARDAAIQLSSQLVAGENFSDARQAAKNELTLGELASMYFDTYAEGRCATIKNMRQGFDLYWKDEQMLKLSQITTDVIQLRINKIATTGHYRTANWALTQINAMINWGIKRGLLKDNPAKNVDKFKMRSRERFIQPHEFTPLLEAISSYSDERLRDFFLLCLYTGARSGNVKSMRWEQIDFDLGTWRISETKNGDSQTIQLSQAALDILKRRNQTKELNPWVIPGGGKNRRGQDSHLVSPRKAWYSILKKAEIADLCIHDLRRTLASFMVMTGASTPIVQKQLGHKSMAAAAVYQRVNNSPVKIAADQAIKVMQHYAEVQTVRKLHKES